MPRADNHKTFDWQMKLRCCPPFCWKVGNRKNKVIVFKRKRKAQLRTMSRSKTGKKRDPVDPKGMKKAITAVSASSEKQVFIREACKVYGVKFVTLVRKFDSFRKFGASSCDYKYTVNYNSKQIFSEHEQKYLVTYLEKFLKCNRYGLRFSSRRF